MKYGTFEVESRKHLIAINKSNQLGKFHTLTKQFREALGRSEDDLVEQDLAPDFQEISEAKFVQYMKDKGLKDGTIESNLSFVRTYFFCLYQNSFSVIAILETRSFGEALENLRSLRGLSRNAFLSILKTEFGVELSHGTLVNYETGKAFPQTEALISTLELALGAPARSLRKKVPLLEWLSVPEDVESTTSPDYKRFRNFGFKCDPLNPTPFEQDIDELLKFKSADHGDLIESGLKRGKRASHNSEVSTEVVRGIYLRYAGYLTMPIVGSHPLCSGKGYDRNTIRLPDLLKSENIKAYLAFLQLRTQSSGKGDNVPEWCLNIFKCLKDICAPDGHLPQTRTRYHEHKGFLSEALHTQQEWEAKLRTQYDVVDQHMQKLVSQSRSQGEADLKHLEPVTNMPRPIRALVNVVNGMTADLDIYLSLGNAFERESHFLIMYRAFFAFESSIPLRISHLNKRVKIDDVYLEGEAGKKRAENVYLRKNDFKNSYSPAVKEGKYSLTFASTEDLKMDVPALIGYYIEKSRPYFLKLGLERAKELREEAQRLEAEGNVKKAKKLIEEADAIPHRLFPVDFTPHRHFNYTYIYSNTEIGWSFHGNRHIVATDKVKFFFDHGHDGYIFAAAALFDTVDTVQTTYAQFGPADIHSLALKLQDQISRKNLPTFGKPSSSSAAIDELELVRKINEYVDRDQEKLLAMSQQELQDTFTDKKILLRIKARLRAIMRKASGL